MPSGFSKYLPGRYGTIFPDSNLTDFVRPVVIVENPFIAAECAAGGSMSFAGDDGVPLPFGLLPGTDLTVGTVIAQVLMPSVLTAASVGDPYGLRCYYRAGGTTTEDRTGLAGGGGFHKFYVPYWDGATPKLREWVADVDEGTFGGSATLADSLVGLGIELDGFGSVSLPIGIFDDDYDWTIELDVRFDTVNQWSAILSNWDGFDSDAIEIFMNNNAEQIWTQSYTGGRTSSFVVGDGDTHTIVSRISATGHDAVIDGDYEGVWVPIQFPSAYARPTNIGVRHGGVYPWDGNVGSLTISNSMVDIDVLQYRRACKVADTLTWGDEVDESGDAGDMVGSTSLTFSTSGTLTADGALAGSSSLSFTTAATLTADGALSGTTSLTFSAAATLTADGALAGSTSLTFTAAGTLTADGALTGSTSLTFATAATLTADGALSGTTSLTFTLTGTLTADGGIIPDTAAIAGRLAIGPTVCGVLAIEPHLAGELRTTSLITGVLELEP